MQEAKDSVDDPKSARKRSSTKKVMPVIIQEASEEADKEEGDVPPPIPPFAGDSTPDVPRRSNRKKAQVSAQDELDEPGKPLPPILGAKSDDSWLNDEQRRALKVVERLGFEGVSQKLALSDLSSESDPLMSPVVPKNSIDFHGRTTFEQEQFNETLSDSPVLVSEARIEETNLNLNNTFAHVDNLELQGELPSPSEEVQSGEASGSTGFKTKVKKANKVASFVKLLNEQERNRQAQSTSHVPMEERRDEGRNPIDLEGRRSFEQDQLDRVLTESPDSMEARIDEGNQNFGSSFMVDNDLKQETGLWSPKAKVQSMQNGTHEGFKKQGRKTNMVSSFVHSLNEQERNRQAESLASSMVKAKILDTLSQSKRKEDDFDPVLLKRLEEARLANETSFAERQRQLEILVEQQNALYQEQLKHQKLQQQQQQEVVRQQWKLQEQLRALEKMQQEFNEVLMLVLAVV